MYNRYCFVITLNYIQIESALFPERELDNNNHDDKKKSFS